MIYRTWPKEPRRSTVMQLTVRSAGPLLSPAVLARAIDGALRRRQRRSAIARRRGGRHDRHRARHGDAGLRLRDRRSVARRCWSLRSAVARSPDPYAGDCGAHGARRRAATRPVIWCCCGSSSRLTAGVAAGIALSVAAEQLVRSLLHEVQPSDATPARTLHGDHVGRGDRRGRPACGPRHARRSDDGAAFRVTTFIFWRGSITQKAKRPSRKASGVSMRVMRVPVVAGTLTYSHYLLRVALA